MAEGYPTEKLLKKVIDDLDDFLPYLVLVGGWVPYLYHKHVWPRELTEENSQTGSLQSSAPLSTTDMDFGVTLVSYPGKESIADRVRNLGYGERHVFMDRMTPFIPVARGKEENERAEVEFIAVLNPPKHVHDRRVGKAIKLNNIKHFEILLENARQARFYSWEVQIPTEEVFVFHKLLTFALRENEDKKRKDLYYVYFMLRFCPDKAKLVHAVRNLIKNRKEGKPVLNNMKTCFAHKDDRGPVAIERENGNDYFINDVRQDAYDRIAQLL